MRKYTFRLSVVLVLGAVTTAILENAPTAEAMPMFARKLGVPCSFCHSTIPRLNEIGFKFRSAGWRLPANIGKPEEKDFQLGDYFSGRIQARYDGSRTKIGPVVSHRSQFTFHELTLYPVTGSFAKYYASLVELSFLPAESAEVENAYIRLDKGTDERWVQARFGIFHPFEGFGASDRPLSISRPFLQTNPANFNQNTFFTPWGFDEAGGEVGFDYQRTSVRATVFNGLTLTEENGIFSAAAAQGGVLRKAAGLPAANTPDFQVFANQILHSDGGNLSAYYYHGNLDLPISGSTANVFRNKFDRVAFYAGYPVVPKLHVLGGYLYGRDDTFTGDRFASRGAFLEIDSPIHEYVTPGVRYDWFDPATSRSNNDVRGTTAFVNIPLQNGFQLIGEYQHRNTRRGAQPDRNDDAFQLRLIFIQ
jgi:hypothetical protein